MIYIINIYSTIQQKECNIVGRPHRKSFQYATGMSAAVVILCQIYIVLSVFAAKNCYDCGKDIDEANDTAVTCITGLPGFEGMCLNIRALQAAYFQYRQEQGSSSSPPSLHEYMLVTTATWIISFILAYSCRKYRSIIYRRLTRWCWGWLGRKFRVILPAHAIKRNRDTLIQDLNFQNWINHDCF